MKHNQALRLGTALRQAREAAGLSKSEAARRTGNDVAWVARIEDGSYTTPDPVRVLRLAEAVGCDPARINKLSGDDMGSGLPGVRTYLRSTTPATQADIDEIESHIERVLAKYDAPDARPGAAI